MRSSQSTLRAVLLAAACSLAGLGPSAAFAAGLKTVVFDVEGVDLPHTPLLDAKLKAAGDLARKTLAQKGFVIVDTAPQATVIADKSPLSQCNGCDQDIAKALGAQLEVTLAVQRVSTVTYNLSGNVKDVATNRVLRQGVVDIRGESDDEWSHGVRFLVKDRLLDPPLPTDAAGLAALVAKDSRETKSAD